MRILFSSTAGAGHFGPMVPFVGSCLRARHEVMIAGPAELAGPAGTAGVSFWPVDDPPRDAMGSALEALGEMEHDEANRWMVAEIFGRLRATAAVPRLRAAISEWRPDVVVRETAELGAAVAAELHDVPHVRIGIGLTAMEEYCLKLVAAPIDELRCAHGLAADPAAQRLRDAPYFTLFPAALEAADVPDQPSTLRFRDPMWPARSARHSTRRFVYITFGTVTGQLPAVAAVYAEAIRAVEDFDGEVLMTVGRQTDPSVLGTPPANMRIARWVDQASVLSDATAVVCHGGGGSTLGALAAGAPLVIVPLFAEDQHINARQVTAVGAGLSATPDAQSIRAVLQTVLRDASYRATAQTLATQLHSYATTDAAPAALPTAPVVGGR